MSNTDLAKKVDAVREFNRFYTGLVGALNERLLSSLYSLTEARILYELAHRQATSAAVLAKDLRLDPAYLSRILRTFKVQALISAQRSERDGREHILTLTKQGHAAFSGLKKASNKEMVALLEPLSEAKQGKLVRAMSAILSILAPQSSPAVPYVIRPHRPGDIGWVIHLHGVLYTREYGWDESFEGLVAEIAGDFLKSHDHTREHCWIAEREGEVVGSVFLVSAGEDTAKLRLLCVESSARGLGIGARLVDELLIFARVAGYRRVTLWTQETLVSALHIYEAAGFKLVGEEKHYSWGKDHVGQYWALDL